MLQLDVKKAIAISIPTPKGIEQRTITVAQLLRDIALSDQRFASSLERVKMSAAIEAAVGAAEAGDGKLSLEPEQYAIVCECFQAPSAGFNPQIARYLLPLFEYIVDAGKKQ